MAARMNFRTAINIYNHAKLSQLNFSLGNIADLVVLRRELVGHLASDHAFDDP